MEAQPLNCFAPSPPVDESRAIRQSPLKWTAEAGKIAVHAFQPILMGFAD
jgi:hypothetical protein